jgi:hypothetical protein
LHVKLSNTLRCNPDAVREALSKDETDVFQLLRDITSSKKMEEEYVFQLQGDKAEKFLKFIQQVRVLPFRWPLADHDVFE